jgi:transcriptional adapter 3
MKREVDEDEESNSLKGGKLKKRKERSESIKEDRPLALGAHEMARQDGAETKVEGGTFCPPALLMPNIDGPC